MRQNRKIVGLFLFTAASIPMLFILFFGIHKMDIRHRMKERLEKEMLVSLTIDSKDLVWVKKGKEILVNGRMFDIKTIHFDENVYKITGLFDDDETALDKKLEEQQKKEGSSGKLIALLLQLSQSIFFDMQKEVEPFIQKQVLFSVSDKSILPSPLRTVLTPPPQIV